MSDRPSVLTDHSSGAAEPPVDPSPQEVQRKVAIDPTVGVLEAKLALLISAWLAERGRPVEEQHLVGQFADSYNARQVKRALRVLHAGGHITREHGAVTRLGPQPPEEKEGEESATSGPAARLPGG